MKVTLFSFVTFFITALSLNAQSNFKSGYIITNDNRACRLP